MIATVSQASARPDLASKFGMERMPDGAPISTDNVTYIEIEP